MTFLASGDSNFKPLQKLKKFRYSSMILFQLKLKKQYDKINITHPAFTCSLFKTCSKLTTKITELPLCRFGVLIDIIEQNSLIDRVFPLLTFSKEMPAR